MVPEHIDTEITSVSKIKIDTRETFWELYTERYYSLCHYLSTRTDGMLISNELFRD